MLNAYHPRRLDDLSPLDRARIVGVPADRVLGYHARPMTDAEKASIVRTADLSPSERARIVGMRFDELPASVRATFRPVSGPAASLHNVKWTLAAVKAAREVRDTLAAVRVVRDARNASRNISHFSK